jgi:hypothetical protein
VLVSFVIGSAQNNMNTANAELPFIDVGTNTDNTPFQIGQTDPLNQGDGPLIDLGEILPLGMSAESLSEYLTLAEYASELGQGGELDLVILAEVPEPTAFALSLLSGLAFARRRRR